MTTADRNIVHNGTQIVVAAMERAVDMTDDALSWLTDTCTDHQTECWSVVWVFAAVVVARLLASLSRQFTNTYARTDNSGDDTDTDDDDDAAFYVRAHTIAPTTPPSKPGVQYVKLQRRGRRTKLQ